MHKITIFVNPNSCIKNYTFLFEIDKPQQVKVEFTRAKVKILKLGIIFCVFDEEHG